MNIAMWPPGMVDEDYLLRRAHVFSKVWNVSPLQARYWLEVFKGLAVVEVGEETELIRITDDAIH